MKFFPEDRYKLARGEHGALVNFWSETCWIGFLACVGVVFFKGWLMGLLALAFLIVVSILIIARDMVGEHRYQLKTRGYSEYSGKRRNDGQD